MKKPWFKAYAADYLLDSKVDAVPLECEGILWRMWCVCHLEGSCPVNPLELARKIRRDSYYVSKYESYYESFFEKVNDKYISHRMEREKRISAVNRANVSQRYKSTTSNVRSTNGSTPRRDSVLPYSDYDYIDVDVALIEERMHEIAKLHPKILDPQHLSQEVQVAIAEAIARDGFEKVLNGTMAMFTAVSRWSPGERRFLPAPPRFFRESQYLKPSEDWSQETHVGKTSAAHQRAQRVKQNIVDAFTSGAGDASQSDQPEHETGSRKRTAH
jgi:hypothetical protein